MHSALDKSAPCCHSRQSRPSAGEEKSDSSDPALLEKNEALAALERALEESPFSVLMTDSGSRILYVNHRFCEETGYNWAEVRSRNPRFLKAGNSKVDFAELWTTIAAGKAWQGEFHNRRKDGVLYQEAAWILPLRDQRDQIARYLSVKDSRGGWDRLKVQAQHLLQTIRQTVEKTGQLAGLVSMCAWCGRVRDRDGQWRNAEVFLAFLPTVRLSHGICPSCAFSHFPDFAKKFPSTKLPRRAANPENPTQ